MAAESIRKQAQGAFLYRFDIDTDMTYRKELVSFEGKCHINPISREVLLTITGFTSD